MSEIVVSDVLDTAPTSAGDALYAIARDIGFLLDGVAQDQVTTSELRVSLEVLRWRLKRLLAGVYEPVR